MEHTCLFCKIIAKEIPNYTVFENDHVLAFLDVHPCSKGHTVVIPKKHYSNLSEMDVETWKQVAEGMQAAHARVYDVLQPAGVNVGINDRAAAGQVVPHVHWHIIPRYEGDGGGSVHSIVRSRELMDVGSVAEMFKRS